MNARARQAAGYLATMAAGMIFWPILRDSHSELPGAKASSGPAAATAEVERRLVDFREKRRTSREEQARLAAEPVKPPADPVAEHFEFLDEWEREKREKLDGLLARSSTYRNTADLRSVLADALLADDQGEEAAAIFLE